MFTITKKIIFSLIWLLVAANALIAQPLPIRHPDSLRMLRQADNVVLNAPFIFRGQEVASKTVRGTHDEVMAVYQLKVVEVIKGNIFIGDTVEVSYSMGVAHWNEEGGFQLPRHGYSLDVNWGDPYTPAYYFTKITQDIPHFNNSKKAFQLFSETPFSVCTYFDGLYFGRLTFKTEGDFFNYINKLLTPKQVATPKEAVEPKQNLDKKGKTKKKKFKKIGNGLGEVESLPINTMYISVGDSTSNLSNYNFANNGWYSIGVSATGDPNQPSFLRSYQFDITYNDFYFYPNAVNDTSKIVVNVSPIQFPTCVAAGVTTHYYTRTITQLTPNKFRVKVELISLNLCQPILF